MQSFSYEKGYLNKVNTDKDDIVDEITKRLEKLSVNTNKIITIERRDWKAYFIWESCILKLHAYLDQFCLGYGWF